SRCCYHRELHSFPTRRSSDLPTSPPRRSAGGRPTCSPARRPWRRNSSPAVCWRDAKHPWVENRGSAGFERGQSTAPGTVAEHLRSEEHTSELQSRENLVCRLL